MIAGCITTGLRFFRILRNSSFEGAISAQQRGSVGGDGFPRVHPQTANFCKERNKGSMREPARGSIGGPAGGNREKLELHVQNGRSQPEVLVGAMSPATVFSLSRWLRSLGACRPRWGIAPAPAALLKPNEAKTTGCNSSGESRWSKCRCQGKRRAAIAKKKLIFLWGLTKR